MSGPSSASDTPITDRHQLVEVLASGEKPRTDWRIGTEHEKFGFRLDDLRPPTFDGERGIEALLTGLTRFGWAPYLESVDGQPARTIALLRDGASVTLEPAGQLELSGAPLETIHQTCKEVGSTCAKCARSRTSSAWVSSAWASSPSGGATRCRGCRRAATGSCATTCRRSASSAST